MNISQARADILSWIENFVERPNVALNGWPPCPYARRARLAGLVEIRAGGAAPYSDLRLVDMDHHDVIILVYEPSKFVPDEFDAEVAAANAAYLIGKDLIALADHPGSPEYVNGVCMNQQQWAMVFIQNLTKLDLAAQDLARKGFYRDWPDHYLSVLFHNRRDPRE